MDSIKRRLAPCAVALLFAAGASNAQAARSVYPTQPDARSLDSGAAGWTNSSTVTGLCVPSLSCPTVTNSVPSSGGAGGGYLLTEVSNFAGVDSAATGIFESPSFSYDGVNGAEPKTVTLKLSRIADVSALVGVQGNSADYSVQLVDTTKPPNVAVVQPTSLEGASDFTEIRAVDVDPSLLKLGHSYRVRINSTFKSGTEIVPGASAGYDNIRVIANDGGGKSGSGSNGSNGSNGGNGSNGNGSGGNGGGGDRFGGNGVVAGAAILKGDRLIVKVRCKGKPAGRCRLNLQGRLHKRGPAVTNKRTARVRAGTKRKVALDVKGRYVATLAARKRVVIKQTVHKGGKTIKGFKKVRVKLG
jgi:hypothetical protein